MKRKRNRLGVDERRQELLSIGVELFAKHPYDELSIEKIAKLAGISKGLLYHYFPTKKAFCIATIRANSEAFIAETNLSDDVPAPVRLRTTLETFFTYAEDNSQSFRAMYRSGVGADPEARDILEANRSISAERLAHGLGISKPSPVMSNILYACVGFIEASTLHWLEHKSGKRSEILARLASAIEAMLITAATSR